MARIAVATLALALYSQERSRKFRLRCFRSGTVVAMYTCRRRQAGISAAGPGRGKVPDLAPSYQLAHPSCKIA